MRDQTWTAGGSLMFWGEELKSQSAGLGLCSECMLCEWIDMQRFSHKHAEQLLYLKSMCVHDAVGWQHVEPIGRSPQHSLTCTAVMRTNHKTRVHIYILPFKNLAKDLWLRFWLGKTDAPKNHCIVKTAQFLGSYKHSLTIESICNNNAKQNKKCT